MTELDQTTAPMSPLELFAGGGDRFFRGNLHTHSTLSDGALPPEEVCRRYRAAGYDFLCLSDHFVGAYGYPVADTKAFRTNAFTTLLGAEVHAGAMGNGEIWHLLAVGLPEDFEPPDAPGFAPLAGQESGAALARRCRAAGAFVAIAHPQWSGLSLEDAASIDAAHAVEIYNHSCLVESDRPDGAAILDQLLTRGRRLSACATDDAHFAVADAFGGWVTVRAPSLDPEALLEALKAGAYYASQGPEIVDVSLEGGVLTIVSSPVARAIAVGPGSASAAARGAAVARDDAGRSVSRIALGRLEDAAWLRAVVVDEGGRRAWLNPIFQDR